MNAFVKERVSPTLDTTYVKSRTPSSYKRVTHKLIYIPAFSVPTQVVNGDVSSCFIKFFYELEVPISLVRKSLRDETLNFVPVLWYTDGNIIVRKKLWHDDNLTLYVDIYENTVLPSTFAIEIWPLNGEPSLTLDSPLYFETSSLMIPDTTTCDDVEASNALFNVVEGTDPKIDVASNVFNGPDEDYFEVGPYGVTTFVNDPIT